MVKDAAVTPWWVTVHGLVLPAPVAGHPALELANTWAGWSGEGRPVGDPARQDYLRTPAHLAVLAVDRGLLPPTWEWLPAEPTPPSDDGDDDVLAQARELRSAAYRLLLGRASPEDLGVVSGLAAEARRHQELEVSAAGCAWVLRATAGRRAPLLAAASALADLATSGSVERVRACPGRDCGWLFVNASGRRRWCQMAVCGNRAKQAAYLARHPADG